MSDWQHVRAMRAEPPGLAANGGRRQKTFGSALQQAEELASAARHAGYPTKPILLFYALSQGYRAVCAAKLAGDWEPSGHGLSVPNRGAPILDVVVKADDHGLYQAAMDVLEEPALIGEVTLGELWASSPELRAGAPSDVARLPGPLRLNLPSPLPGQGGAPEDYLFVLVEGLSVGENEAEIKAAIATYPTLAAAEPAPYPTGLRVGVLSDEESRDGVAFRRTTMRRDMFPVLRVPLEDAAAFRDCFADIATGAVQGTNEFRFALPAVGVPSQVLGPLPMWWPLILGLSSLARYYPASWAAALNIDRSPLAGGLERLLDTFQEAVPHYILGGLRDL